MSDNTNNNWIVIKLGGTSQCKIGYNNIKKILQENQKDKFIFVLSALSGITNLLEKFTQTKDITFIDKVMNINNNFSEELSFKFHSINSLKIGCMFRKFYNDCLDYKNKPLLLSTI